MSFISSRQHRKDNMEKRNLGGISSIVSFKMTSTCKDEYWSMQFKEHMTFTLQNIDGNIYTFVILFKVNSDSRKDEVSKFIRSGILNHLTPERLAASTVLIFNCSEVAFEALTEQKVMRIFVM